VAKGLDQGLILVQATSDKDSLGRNGQSNGGDSTSLSLEGGSKGLGVGIEHLGNVGSGLSGAIDSFGKENIVSISSSHGKVESSQRQSRCTPRVGLDVVDVQHGLGRASSRGLGSGRIQSRTSSKDDLVGSHGRCEEGSGDGQGLVVRVEGLVAVVIDVDSLGSSTTSTSKEDLVSEDGGGDALESLGTVRGAQGIGSHLLSVDVVHCSSVSSTHKDGLVVDGIGSEWNFDSGNGKDGEGVVVGVVSLHFTGVGVDKENSVGKRKADEIQSGASQIGRGQELTGRNVEDGDQSCRCSVLWIASRHEDLVSSGGNGWIHSDGLHVGAGDGTGRDGRDETEKRD